MELICESGATKSNWVVIDKDIEAYRMQLDGINPSTSTQSINLIDDFHRSNQAHFKQIHFYCAGINGQSAKQQLRQKFNQLYPGIPVFLYSDIIAAARSVSHNRTSIVSILGTGSNTILFNGHEIVEVVPSLGYLFGDAGSGFHIGQLIVNSYFHDQMPESDKSIFSEKYIMDKSQFKKDIYKSDKPNSDIARFTYFLNEASKDFRDIILTKAFGSFFENLSSGIKDSHKYKLNFVGSIASVFKEELLKLSQIKNYSIDTIVKDPLEGLIRYHQSIVKL